MGQVTVSTPLAGHNGKVGGVTFVDGKAVVDEDTHAAELAYFRAQGYDVAVPEPDIDALRAEATELGIKRVGTKSAERLEAEIAEARALDDATRPDTDDTPDGEPGNDEETTS